MMGREHTLWREFLLWSRDWFIPGGYLDRTGYISTFATARSCILIIVTSASLLVTRR
jgi:hypothetical protein